MPRFMQWILCRILVHDWLYCSSCKPYSYHRRCSWCPRRETLDAYNIRWNLDQVDHHPGT